MTSRSTWAISGQSWHGRLYLFWKRHAEYKNGDDYRESLCHYVRVILFWGPISLLVHLKHHKYDWLRPITVLAPLTLLSGLVVGLILAPGNTLEFMAWVMGAFLLAAGFTWFMAENDERITQWGRNHSRQISAPFRSVGRNILTPLWRWVLRPVYRLLSWPVAWDIPLLGFLVAGGVVAGCVVSEYFRLVVAIILAGCIICTMLSGLIYLAYEALKANSRKPKKVHTGPTGREIAIDYIVAKKHRVCPLIEVKE